MIDMDIYLLTIVEKSTFKGFANFFRYERVKYGDIFLQYLKAILYSIDLTNAVTKVLS